MERESVFQKRLKDLDLFKRLPKNMSKGSLLGVVMTVICIVTVALLLLNEVITFMTKEIESGMRIDHRKDDQDVEVHLSIDLHKFPCHLLGLDIVDYVGTHRVAEHRTLKYWTLNTNGEKLKEVDMDMNEQDTKAEFMSAYEKEYGCRIEGYFNILLVPGNFHIAFHGKAQLYMEIMRERAGQLNVDLTHTINHLYFGATKNQAILDSLKSDFNLQSVQTLNNYKSTTVVPQPGQFSYRYKLLIVPTDLIYEDGHQYDIFQYKTFWNVATMEMQGDFSIWVEYDLSSLSMVEKRKHKYLSEFIIHICGIIGGLIAFMTFLHNLIQKSVVRLLHKAGLGKLE
jgi:hypothetical protein